MSWRTHVQWQNIFEFSCVAQQNFVTHIFWTSQWYENHTKILKTNVGNLGVTEIEFILIGLLMVTGIFGREIWALTARQLMPSSLISLVETKFTNGRDFIDHPLYVYVYWSIVVVMIILNLIMVFTILLKQKNKTEQVLQFLPITIVVFLGKLCLKINIFRTFLIKCRYSFFFCIIKKEEMIRIYWNLNSIVFFKK